VLPRAPVAGVVVGSRPSRHVLFFLLADGWVREELDFTLNTVRAALGSRFLEERVRGSFSQAAEIQQSLLVEEPPDFAGFQLAARSVAAEEVGGDFYDFLSLEEDALMGLAIGDASGHGLPAALLVRDVVTGLRMGIEKNLKIAHVFSKLNRVIHRSNLSSRFISVFYGELEENGHVIYVNAGHPPPLVFSALAHRGALGGRHGDRPAARGAFPARSRLPRAGRRVRLLHGRNPRAPQSQRRVLRRGRPEGGGPGRPGASAEDVVAEIFARAFAFGDDRPWEDDATLLVVRRDPAGQ
jgi:sigma-B regulation protein RsbU (phosphoserine phosphatase)